ncbi:MAG: tRNA 2-thiocytidine(32) synthetase TtcA [Lachnospiraceae bacterium]|nr:tRNA 2-thiocytidine(32) synthetase TtcA [Lachnospiraceae bacterium]
MTLQRLFSYTRKALDDYGMIKKNDKIAIGISGGKDSLALLYGLQGLQQFYPVHFELMAVTVDLGFPDFDLKTVKSLCSKLKIPYEIITTEIADIIFKERKESSPCALCAKMRKGALNAFAQSKGCNKIAYAHHRDDVIETLMMSLIFEGRFHTFSPKTYLERSGLTVIRPLLYIPEKDVIGFRNKYHLPVIQNACPADGHTKREYIKNLLSQLNRENPGVRERIFTAVLNSSLEDWKSQKNISPFGHKH